MSESIKKFLETLNKDEALQSALQNSKSPEEAYAAAKSVVGDLDQKEFMDTMAMIKKMADQNGELSEDDLDMVAGGWDDTTTVTLITGLITAAASAASAAF